MVRPSPAPSMFCASGARQNRSVADPAGCSVMPGPVVADLHADRRRRSAGTDDLDPAAPRSNLTALSINASSAWSRAVGTVRAYAGAGPARRRQGDRRCRASGCPGGHPGRGHRGRVDDHQLVLPPLGTGQGEQPVQDLGQPVGLLQRQPVLRRGRTRRSGSAPAPPPAAAARSAGCAAGGWRARRRPAAAPSRRTPRRPCC